jgi:Fur family ferric uptake transcriptional regulator
MNSKLVEKKLELKNIAITAMRKLVLDVFLQHKKAFSLADLEAILENSDRSTLYRTLKTFEQKGLIHGIQENNTTQYLLCNDACDAENHYDFHLHFYCNQCEKTTCLEDIDFEGLKFPKGYKIQDLKFVANGICKECTAKMQ